jgi:nicotinamide-nucleotide amidase
MQNSVEIISIGNELLIGQTMDTNSYWIAKRVNALGWSVQRITIVRDSLSAISGSIVEALARKPELLFTIGGLGPTYDDMTLRGLSIAIRKPLRLNYKALGAIKKKYGKIERTTITSYRRKMAILPSGAEPLPNSVGTAPGVLVKARDTMVVSFPGVPQEMKAIFKASVVPILRESGASAPHEAYIMILGIIESALAPVLEQVRKRFSTLYFKSHPMGRESGVRSLIKLHMYTIGSGNDAEMKDALSSLLRGLALTDG